MVATGDQRRTPRWPRTCQWD